MWLWNHGIYSTVTFLFLRVFFHSFCKVSVDAVFWNRSRQISSRARLTEAVIKQRYINEELMRREAVV